MNKTDTYLTANIVVVDQKRKRITVILHDKGEIVLIPYEELIIAGENKK